MMRGALVVIASALALAAVPVGLAVATDGGAAVAKTGLSPLDDLIGPESAKLPRRGFADLELGCFVVEQDVSKTDGMLAAVGKSLAGHRIDATETAGMIEFKRDDTRGLLWVTSKGDGAVATACFFEHTHRHRCEPMCADMAKRGAK